MSKRVCVVVAAGMLAPMASAAYLFEIDTDGQDDGVLTFNSNFSFGGDTTTASQSAAAQLVGATGGDSIFGGNGSLMPDTYLYTYNPGVDGDNLALAEGTDLGGGNFSTGIAAGGAGRYRVYAGWPVTSNVSGGLVTYDVTTAGDSFSVMIDQNTPNAVPNTAADWVLLGEIDFTSGSIDVAQMSGNNTFVSMRAYGLLFEPVPAPSGLAVIGVAGLFGARRRR